MPDDRRAGAANQPFAAAMRRARALAHVTLDEWAEKLTAAGAPATKDQAWKWEQVNRRGVIVPAYALAAAARVIGRTITELVSEDQQPTLERFRALEQRMADLESALMSLARFVGAPVPLLDGGDAPPAAEVAEDGASGEQPV